MTSIRRILIANRGEIALRIQRTARRMGIESVAVYSDADAQGPFVRLADSAVRIGPAESRASYLNIEAVLDAALRAGVDAVHPGFGFLAENAAFAQAVADRGLTFIGPTPAAISAMGLKREAKRLVSEAGVAVIPGGAAEDQSTAGLVDEAKRIGLPVLIKASAGGGGKGMRVVHEPSELEAAIDGARREAKSSFSDETLLIEKYIERPRHVEIQILGDHHGNLVHLFERECSIQRRHQKIVEESPSPALDAELRERMGRAGVEVGRAVGYTNAGTVEFILAPDGNFYFLEVNTRLQVEHPVTEAVTGIDLVREQIRIAEGQPLGYAQDDLRIDGAAIEVRLYAEDAENGFLPTTGTVVGYREPALPGVRMDSGIEQGFEVGIHYDPMLAKVIAHAPTRQEAARLLHYALGQLVVHGVTTNREFLRRVLTHPEFLDGNTHTHFIADHLPPSSPEVVLDATAELSAIVAALTTFEERRAERSLLPGIRPGFSNNRLTPERVELGSSKGNLAVEYSVTRDGMELSAGNTRVVARHVAHADGVLSFEDTHGVRHRAQVSRAGDRCHVQLGGRSFDWTLEPRFPLPGARVTAGACIAPMPGKVVRVCVEPGSEVNAGDTLVILEAMKMEHGVKAPSAGVVSALHVAEGDQVEADAVLAVVTPLEPAQPTSDSAG